MEITWQGENTVTIKGNKATVLINPASTDDKDVEIFSKEQENPKHLRIFDWPGEYEKNGVPITCMRASTKPKDEAGAEETLITKFEVDGVKFCHLGDLGHEIPDEIADKIGDIDVLIVPVEGNLSIKKIQNIIEQIEPRAVLPVKYSSLASFLKELSVGEIEPQKVYKLKGVSQLPEDKREYIVLEKA